MEDALCDQMQAVQPSALLRQNRSRAVSGLRKPDRECPHHHTAVGHTPHHKTPCHGAVARAADAGPRPWCPRAPTAGLTLNRVAAGASMPGGPLRSGHRLSARSGTAPRRGGHGGSCTRWPAGHASAGPWVTGGDGPEVRESPVLARKCGGSCMPGRACCPFGPVFSRQTG